VFEFVGGRRKYSKSCDLVSIAINEAAVALRALKRKTENSFADDVAGAEPTEPTILIYSLGILSVLPFPGSVKTVDCSSLITR